MSEIKRESPLIGQSDAIRGAAASGEAGVTLFERPFLGHIVLRGRSEEPVFAAACRQVLGIEPPSAPNTVVEGEGVVACWQRPTQWLILCEGDTLQGRLDGLRQALGETHSGVIDESGGQTLIAVSGDRAADVLAKGTTLDLHPRAFGAGRCAGTLLAKSQAFIRVVEPGRSFEVVVRRSFADYLWQWLRDAAQEYDCRVLEPVPRLA